MWGSGLRRETLQMRFPRSIKRPQARGGTSGLGLVRARSSFAQLNGQFSHLLEVVDGADGTPTQTAQDAFQSPIAGGYRSPRGRRRRQAVPSLNDQLLRVKLPTIKMWISRSNPSQTTRATTGIRQPSSAARLR